MRISIEHVLDQPLSRTTLKEHPLLKGLSILHFANATNYNIKPEEDAALQLLISGGAIMPASIEDRIEQWHSQTGYPTEKDVERRAQREALATGF